MAQRLTLVADSTAWIAFYRTDESQLQQAMIIALRQHTLLVPDLVLFEVLRGIDSEKQAKAVVREFESFECIEIGGRENALLAAKNYRELRSKSITVRGTVDLLIGTWCLANHIPLIHDDRDFVGFEKYLGLKVWHHFQT